MRLMPGFPPSTIFLPNCRLEVATRFIRSKLENPRCRGYVAEKDGYVVGSVFVTAVDDCPAGAIGPLTVEPAHEGGVGAALMQEAVTEAGVWVSYSFA
jgi:predicted N-acetyltransferase YhbS